MFLSGWAAPLLAPPTSLPFTSLPALSTHILSFAAPSLPKLLSTFLLLGFFLPLGSPRAPTYVVSLQAEPVRVVQPTPLPAGAATHLGKPVHVGQQPLVPCGGLHAARLRDHAPGIVHALCQWSLVSARLSSLPSPSPGQVPPLR